MSTKAEDPCFTSITMTTDMNTEKDIQSSQTEENVDDGVLTTSDTSNPSNKGEIDQTMRYLPSNRKPDAAFTFPEKLMSLMKYATQSGHPETYCVAWLSDGKSFIIRNPETFTRKVLPKFFKATKFSSFTRKLYRWGFRQVNRGIGPDDPIIFGNEYFQRDHAELMTKMKSTTAASTRKQEEDNLQKMLAQKRALDSWEADRNQKRMLFNSIMQQNMMQPNFGNLNGGGVDATAAKNIPSHPLLMQNLQHQNIQQQQQLMFGCNMVPSAQLMNSFGNFAGNVTGGSITQNCSMNNNNNNQGMVGLKTFDILSAQQQQQQQQLQQNPMNGSMNPILNFQVPNSNHGFVMNNIGGIPNGNGMMNISTNGMNVGSMNGFNNAGGGTGAGGHQNPASTADIVNAAINALKHAP